MAKKGVPKQDGSGGGRRLNKGRGGCSIPKDIGLGSGTRSGRARRGPGSFIPIVKPGK